MPLSPCSKTSCDEVAHPEKIKFCLFCYKTVKIVKTTVGSSLVVGNFLKSLERFVGGKCSRSGRNLNCCEDCEFMISSFCEVFHQLKCLELQLEWKLELILKIIKLANRVPSRTQRVKEELDEGARKGLEAVRSDIRKKCAHRISNSQPRVLLKRPRLKKEDSCGDSKVFKSSSAGEEEAVAISVGWITSFAAVVMMGMVGATDSSQGLEAEEFIQDDDLDEDSAVCGVWSQQISEEDQVDELSMSEKGPLGLTVADLEPVSTKLEKFPENDKDPDEGSLMTSSEDEDEETMGEALEISSPVTPNQFTEQEASDSPSSPFEEEIKPEIKREVAAPKKKPRCPTCKKTFRYGRSLKFHIRRVHKIHYCAICKVSFNSYHRLRSHNLDSRNHQILRNRFLKKQQRTKVKPELLQVPPDPDHENPQSLQKVASKNPKPEVKATSNPYNLRLKRKRSFKEMAEGTKNKVDYEEDPDKSSGGRRIDFWRKSGPNLYCRQDGCSRRFLKREEFDRHRKFHAGGRYKCNFCEIMESNVAKLSEHERMKHSTIPGDSSSSTALNETFYCSRCPFETRQRSTFISHFSEHLPEFEGTSKFTECDICKQKVSRSCLEPHMKARHDMNGVDPTEVVRCKVPECQAFFVGKNGKYHLSIHRQRVHRRLEEEDQVLEEEISGEEDIEEGTNRFKCKFCNRKFIQFRFLKAHQKIFHSRQPGQVDHPKKKYKFICPVVQCTEKFISEEGLQGHQKLHGSFKCDFCEVVKDYAPELAIHESEKHSNKWNHFNCLRCPFSSFHKSIYISHFLDTHLQLPVQRCPICQVETAGRHEGYRGTHFQTHHNTEGLEPSEIHNCDQCPAYFLHARQLVFHKLEIHFRRKCPECGRRYKELDHLRIHIVRAHPNSKYFPNSVVFKCGVKDCDRVYMTAGQLEAHKKQRHLNCDGGKGNGKDNYFQCPECPKIFHSKAKLGAHKFNVHPKMSFVCEECGKVWKTKATLEMHMTYHKGPDEWKFQCSTCGRKLASKQKLEQHQRTHTKEKPFICQYCGEKYAHRHNWRNHVKTKHPEEFEHEVGGNGGGVNKK